MNADCVTRADIGFIIDSSGSIRDKGANNWNLMLDFMARIVRSVDVGRDDVHVAVVKFSDFAELEFRLDRYFTQNDAVNAIRRMGYVGAGTNTQSGLRLLRERVFDAPGDRRDAPNIAIVITDGNSTIQRDRTIPEAELLKRSGVSVIAVGITNAIVRAELEGMASSPDYVLTSADFEALEAEISRLLRVTCSIVTPTGSTLLPSSKVRAFHGTRNYPQHEVPRNIVLVF